MPLKREDLIIFKVLALFLISSAIFAPWLYAAKDNLQPSQSFQMIDSQLENFFLTLRQGTIPHFERIAGSKFVEDLKSFRIIYTLDPVLQIKATEILRQYRPSFAAFIALDPKTGKILALADYSRENPYYLGIWQKATYPAASIFKLITAAAALEKGVLQYNSLVSFRGNQYLLTPQKLNEHNKKERRVSFEEALAKSNNVVFGRVACKLLGAQTLRRYSEAFGFNQNIHFDFPLEKSRALIPEESYDLARCGAGFGNVTLNPLHAAVIASLIANRGVMIRPHLIASVTNQEGQKVYEAQREILGQPISFKTASDLSRMMRRTVEDGTASKIFQPAGKKILKNLTICGKTGHLSGDNPPGLYDWFIGFAPAEDAQIAFSALAINQNGLKAKGTLLAREVLKEFFRDRVN